VWIDPGAVGDTGAPRIVQGNPANRRVLLIVKSVGSRLLVTVSDNPWYPLLKPDGIRFDIRYAGTVSVITALIAEITIYDAVGNAVYKSSGFRQDNTGALWTRWNGTNRSGRLVGTGSYVAFVKVQEGGRMLETKKIMIGVRRQ